MDKPFYTAKEAAEKLGLHHSTVGKLRKKGKMHAIKIGERFAYTLEEIERVKKTHYNTEGLTYKDIARIYGLPKYHVHKKFRQMRFKPSAWRRYRGIPAHVFTEEQVRKYANILGWEPVQSNSKSDK